ncbi:uncharacterized protein A4U43_C08F34890 [Asparagus officinalis]|uniref:RING-H2 finger protein ATL52-like n=1 Tax=Asparagus officinalis TaxID=4686 RepID=UPI00098DFD4D|nr:RING-H2 finger protein ATL52-like [Asparagus officinalis]ONK61916.1 uncharacterized protein A4U43_C08F34890 [Asparagus officinalis]
MFEGSLFSSSSSTWSKLSISFIGAASALILLFCLYKLLKDIYLSVFTYQRHLPSDHNPETPSLDSETRGLNIDVINSLQANQYKKDADSGSSDCAICLAEFGEGELLRVLPSCSHSFHVSCIDTWLSSHSDCPLCRKKVLGKSGDTSPRVPFAVSLETLPREDMSGVRLLDYHLLEFEAMRN